MKLLSSTLFVLNLLVGSEAMARNGTIIQDRDGTKSCKICGAGGLDCTWYSYSGTGSQGETCSVNGIVGVIETGARPPVKINQKK